MFEILKPAPRRPIDRRDDDFQAVPMLARRLGTNRVCQLHETLITRPTLATLEVIAQRVVPFLVRVQESCLVRMEGQSDPYRPRLHPFQRLPCFARIAEAMSRTGGDPLVSLDVRVE